MAALPAFQPPLGPQPANGPLYSPQQVTLVLREKVWSLSGDTFTVHTADGANVMQVKGKLASLRSKKTFTDMHGNELFVLAEKRLKIFKTFHADSAAGAYFEFVYVETSADLDHRTQLRYRGSLLNRKFQEYRQVRKRGRQGAYRTAGQGRLVRSERNY